MEAGQEIQEGIQYEEEPYVDESDVNFSEEQGMEQQEEYVFAEEETKQKQEEEKQNVTLNSQSVDRSSFVHGLSVGLGIGCIATFVIMWITVFFSPQLPSAVTYEAMLSIFIYPLVYLLAVGLIALTAGIVREYFTRKSRL